MNNRINIRILVVTVVLLLGQVSCKKIDKLEGEYEQFAGTWKWVYSMRSYDLCSNYGMSYNINPTTENKTFTLSLSQDGHFEFFKNSASLRTGFITISNYQENSVGKVLYINLDANPNDRLVLWLDNSQLWSRDFPYKRTTEFCDSYVNFFEAE